LPEKMRLGLVEGAAIRLQEARVLGEQRSGRVHHGLLNLRVHREAHFTVVDVDEGYCPFI
jgi:hypothetical protein